MFGQYINIDTTGIPGRCVGEIENTMNAMLRVAENPNFTATMLMNALGPHMDILMASGCDAYLDLYSARVNEFTSRYA